MGGLVNISLVAWQTYAHCNNLQRATALRHQVQLLFPFPFRGQQGGDPLPRALREHILMWGLSERWDCPLLPVPPLTPIPVPPPSSSHVLRTGYRAQAGRQA